MKAIINTDKRNDIDRKFDMMFNGMVAKAKLTPKQSQIVSRYLREIMGMRLVTATAPIMRNIGRNLTRTRKNGTETKSNAI